MSGQDSPASEMEYEPAYRNREAIRHDPAFPPRFSYAAYLGDRGADEARATAARLREERLRRGPPSR